MADDKHNAHEAEDDISRMMYIISAVLAVSMIIGYLIAF